MLDSLWNDRQCRMLICYPQLSRKSLFPSISFVARKRFHLRRCDTLWSAREIASVALSAEQERAIEAISLALHSISRRLKAEWNTFVCLLFCSAESATEALSLALHSVPRVFHLALRRGETSSLSHFLELYGAASVAPMWFPIALSLLLIKRNKDFTGPGNTLRSIQLLEPPSRFQQAQRSEIILRSRVIKNRLYLRQFPKYHHKNFASYFWNYKEHENNFSKFHSSVVP